MIELGGRRFGLADLDRMTFAQSQYLLGLATQVGLDAIWPVDDESDEQYRVRMYAALSVSGRTQDVLGGYLIPEGETVWTRQIAVETAAHVSGLTDTRDHQCVYDLATRVVPDFFARALGSLGTSLSSLPSASARSKQGGHRRNAGGSTKVNGRRSSARSPGSITKSREPSGTGRSGRG